jgi:hypothetical protein
MTVCQVAKTKQMKQIILLFTYFILFNCHSSIGQELTVKNTQLDKLSDADFIKAKDGYLKMSLTEDYKNLREASISFAVKLGRYVDLDSLKSDEALKNWISENYKLTNFKNAEEGIKLIELTYELQAKIERDNPEVFALVLCANASQRKEIYEPEYATSSDEESVRTQKRKIRNGIK